MDDKKIKDKEYAELKKKIFEEATNVRIDYEENPTLSEESGSVVVIHQEAEFLDEEE